ncbi:gamma-glutamyl-gamma-aminobutyrate hydrolase family protein [Micromonospora echinofusca]|uniref:gamma-glutamyl-gamma-aminobutyrate hydrolase family protein n=1 Tax=Micromonospora echinofusca TaxID=47858 RepID=UPI0027DB875A|nr:gamma-glutamyl-gamma-aminobutyrate hydrolase family protein [Micromonospora echinofusca]
MTHHPSVPVRRRPVVGITAYVEPAGWGPWRDLSAVLVPYAYVRAVTGAGARAVVLPPDDGDADVLAGLDGLVLAGGADLDPARYAEPPGRWTESRPDRDAGEFTLLTAALGADLPVLGVCRGMQLLAVAYGGRLHQHLPDVVGHDRHRPAPGVFGTHPVRFAPGSRIATVMAGSAEVNTYHHQGVADPGGLTVTGWADDGVVEAVEDPGRRFVLGVQWHPEVADDLRPFRALVAAAGVP